jgi:hypothetical protein
MFEVLGIIIGLVVADKLIGIHKTLSELENETKQELKIIK